MTCGCWGFSTDWEKELAGGADLAGLDFAGSAGDLAGMAAPPSGKMVTGKTFALEKVAFVDGPDIYVEGYPHNQSAAAKNGGQVMADIPMPALNQKGYIHIEGMIAAGLPALPTIFALGPQLTFDGGATNQGIILHFFSDDSSATGIRTALAHDLSTHGDIPTADGVDGATFGSKWNWAFGTLAQFANGTLHEYSGATVTVANAMCKVFYARSYGTFKGNPSAGLIDFAATVNNVSSGIVILCPKTVTGDITLMASGAVDADTVAPVTLNPIPIPAAPNVYFDWGP
jgi:hypothetical protein